ncbi:MAG TPA: class I SAM-dependent methyltransferase [Candidatus Sulfotelmatobacter sp.]
MNSRHSKVTDWGLSHISIMQEDTVLDVGCGGGRTISKLATKASQGRVYGVDYSGVCVAVARKVNAHSIDERRVEIREGSVSQLPFEDHTFELVTAVETHFWWPDVLVGMREIRRVLKPGGTFVIIAEVYRGAATRTAKLLEEYARKTGLKLLSVDEHRDLLQSAGYAEVQIIEQPSKGWICGIGKNPIAEGLLQKVREFRGGVGSIRLGQ